MSIAHQWHSFIKAAKGLSKGLSYTEYVGRISIALVIGLATCKTASAGAEGYYYVEGKYTDGTSYLGSVSVVRTGEAYRVRWKLTDGEYRGAGMGAAPTDGAATVGPASGADEFLTVGYRGGDDDDVGVALYMEQSDGSWHGVWNEYGSHRVSTEVWTPIPPVIDQESLEY